jgi:ribosomal protein S6
MNNKEEIKKSNYEILCIIKESDSEKNQNLIKEIEKSISLNKVKFSSEVKKLAYRIENLETAEYLLLNFEAKRSEISEVEEIIRKSFVVSHMTINLDTEKKIKIKKNLKAQKSKKVFKKTGFVKQTSNKYENRQEGGYRNDNRNRQQHSDRHSSSIDIR